MKTLITVYSAYRYYVPAEGRRELGGEGQIDVGDIKQRAVGLGHAHQPPTGA